MPITYQRVVLSDGRAAMRVDGLPTSPIYLRVRLLSKEITNPSVGAADLALKIQPYQVTADGAELTAGLAITRTVNGAALAQGLRTLAEERSELLSEALQQMVGWLATKAALASATDELVE